VGELRLEREVVSLTLREPGAPAVVDDQPERAGEPPVEILHTEVVPLKLEVADPAGRDDEHRPLAPRHVGEALPAAVATECDPRLHENGLTPAIAPAPRVSRPTKEHGSAEGAKRERRSSRQRACC